MESLLPWVCIFLNICCFTPCVGLIAFIKWGTVQNSVGCAVYAFFSAIFFVFWFVGVCVTFSAVAVEHSQHSVEVFLCLIHSWGFGYAWFIAQVTSRIFVCLCLRVTKIQKNMQPCTLWYWLFIKQDIEIVAWCWLSKKFEILQKTSEYISVLIHRPCLQLRS